MHPLDATTGSSPTEELIGSLDRPEQQADSRALIGLFEAVSGQEATLWTGKIVGFGLYHYRYESGHEGDAPPLGFSPRKGKFALYGLLNHPEAERRLERLGKHRRGVSCLYVNRLSDVDLDVLSELARLGYAHTMEHDHRP